MGPELSDGRTAIRVGGGQAGHGVAIASPRAPVSWTCQHVGGVGEHTAPLTNVYGIAGKEGGWEDRTPLISAHIPSCLRTSVKQPSSVGTLANSASTRVVVSSQASVVGEPVLSAVLTASAACWTSVRSKVGTSYIAWGSGRIEGATVTGRSGRTGLLERR